MLYSVFPLVCLAMAGFFWYVYGAFAFALSIGFYTAGWASHKHRSAWSGQYAKAQGFWASVKAWFRA